MDILTIIAIIGSIASILGVILYFVKRYRNRIKQNGSSIIKGNKNIVKIKHDDSKNLESTKEEIIQSGSSIIKGSGNIVEININEDIEFDTSILITNGTRNEVEFSISSTGGLFEISKLFIEIDKIYNCVLGPIPIEAVSIRCNYKMILVPEIKIYPLLPPTLSNSLDSWTYKDKEIDLFSVRFKWPKMTSIDLRIKAETYNHIKKEKQFICSHIFNLSRQGEHKGNDFYLPGNSQLKFSPFLYKILTVDDMIESINNTNKKLINDSYNEISDIFNLSINDFQNLIESSDGDMDYIFNARVNPLIAIELLKIANQLKIYL
jgi:hypothetical protein